MKYFAPHEVTVLTSGQKKITSDHLEKIIVYHGGDSLIQDFFKRYLKEAKSDMLEKFVKFTTGSSKLPYETKQMKILVNFKKPQGGKVLLPIAHTCTQEIEVR